MALKIAIKDEASAKQWLTMVQEINTDYSMAMADASQCIIEMSEFADGTMVDEFVKYGTDLLNASESVFKAIDTIADTVNGILGFVKNFSGEVLGGITKLASKVLTK